MEEENQEGINNLFNNQSKLESRIALLKKKNGEERKSEIVPDIFIYVYFSVFEPYLYLSTSESFETTKISEGREDGRLIGKGKKPTNEIETI